MPKHEGKAASQSGASWRRPVLPFNPPTDEMTLHLRLTRMRSALGYLSPQDRRDMELRLWLATPASLSVNMD